MRASLYSFLIDYDDKVSTEDNEEESSKAREIAIGTTRRHAFEFSACV